MSYAIKTEVTITFKWALAMKAFRRCEQLKEDGYRERRYWLSPDNKKDSFIILSKQVGS